VSFLLIFLAWLKIYSYFCSRIANETAKYLLTIKTTITIMKKNFYYLSLLLGLVFGMTMFTACGGSDDDDDDLFKKKQEMPETQKTPETIKVWHTCNYCDGAKTDFNCNGTGKCQKCNGNGSYSEKCGICNGVGTLTYPSGPCPYCNATGQRTHSCSRCYSTGKCNICSGTGKCPTCKGEGGWYLEEKSYSEDSDGDGSSSDGGSSSTRTKCEYCNGSGKCNNYKTGDGSRYCHGDGKCWKCDGDGYFYDMSLSSNIGCSYCYSSGSGSTVNGTLKPGDGKCDKCHGSGDCQICGGKGYID
jgi:hypothetical protein